MASNNAPSTATSTQTLHRQLLSPPVLDILRAAGFTRARPAVLDTVVDLTYRYLNLLSTHTAVHAQARCAGTADEPEITITDIRKALQDVGALHPQLSELEELARGEEDMRGVEAFLEWASGDVNAEIRRIAGMSPPSSSIAATAAVSGGATAAGTAGEMVGNTVTKGTNMVGSGRRLSAAAVTAVAAAEAEAVLATAEREDYLTQLKKKHSKTGEESRWQGTVLGKDMGEREVIIEGWEVSDLEGWGRRLRMRQMGLLAEGDDEGGAVGGSGSSSPLSEMTGSGIDSGFG